MQDTMPAIASLSKLRSALNGCRRCPLYRDATQAVPGAGPKSARMMLIGEQPGNEEDLTGEPFVGPAGRMLDRALADAGLDRKKTFITNAVKHFKFELRGKRRLHKKPNSYEIERCRWWNDLERKLVKPSLIVTLGVTAARSVMQRNVTIASLRGKVLDIADVGHVMVTVHPSLLLRIPDARDRAREYRRFVADLKMGRKFLQGAAP